MSIEDEGEVAQPEETQQEAAAALDDAEGQVVEPELVAPGPVTELVDLLTALLLTPSVRVVNFSLDHRSMTVEQDNRRMDIQRVGNRWRLSRLGDEQRVMPGLLRGVVFGLLEVL